MGTYPTTPSLVLGTGEDLQKHINANKEELIGKPILDKFGADLPYLPNPPRVKAGEILPPEHEPDEPHRADSKKSRTPSQSQ